MNGTIPSFVPSSAKTETSPLRSHSSQASPGVVEVEGQEDPPEGPRRGGERDLRLEGGLRVVGPHVVEHLHVERAPPRRRRRFAANGGPTRRRGSSRRRGSRRRSRGGTRRAPSRPRSSGRRPRRRRGGRVTSAPPTPCSTSIDRSTARPRNSSGATRFTISRPSKWSETSRCGRSW